MLCIRWFAAANQTIIDFVLSVMSFAYAGLLGVFFTALFTKRGNTASAIAGLVVGGVTVFALRPEVWQWVLAMRTGATDSKLALTLAWPWQLLAGTIAATAVCCVGRPARGGIRALGALVSDFEMRIESSPPPPLSSP